MTYGAKEAPVKKAGERRKERMEVGEIKIVLWMCGAAREGRISNAGIRERVKMMRWMELRGLEE